MARLSAPALGRERNVDDAAERLLLEGQRDQGAEQRKAGDEAFGAVDRIENPVESATCRAARLLADDAMIGKTLLYTFAQMMSNGPRKCDSRIGRTESASSAAKAR